MDPPFCTSPQLLPSRILPGQGVMPDPERQTELAEKRKKELIEEVSQDNAHMKALIHILRNMLSDAAMWDCCSKLTNIRKATADK